MEEGVNKFGKYVIFKNEKDDIAYKFWLKTNSHGFVLNDNEYNHTMLHRADCRHINGDGHVENKQYKVCSWEIDVLKQYCREKKNGFELRDYCKVCKPLKIG